MRVSPVVRRPVVGWRESKVSRIETGISGVKPADVERLLDAYAVAEPELRELLVGLAGSEGNGRPSLVARLPRGSAAHVPRLHQSGVPGQRHAHAGDLGGTRTADTRVRTGGDPVTVGGLEDGKLDALVEVRLARQNVLRSNPPLELTAVLDEAVFSARSAARR